MQMMQRKIWKDIEIYAILWGWWIASEITRRLADGAGGILRMGIFFGVVLLVNWLICAIFRKYLNADRSGNSADHWRINSPIEFQDSSVGNLFVPRPDGIGVFPYQKPLDRACQIVEFLAMTYATLSILIGRTLPDVIAYMNLRSMPYALLDRAQLPAPDINGLLASYPFVLSVYINGFAVYVVAILLRLFSIYISKRPVAASSIGKDRKLYVLLHAIATIALPAAYLFGTLSIEHVFVTPLIGNVLLCIGWVSLVLWSVSAYVSGAVLLFYLRARPNGTTRAAT